MLPTTNKPENFQYALARRVLTQQLPTALSDADASRQVHAVVAKVRPLAVGFDATAEAANEQLRGQQMGLAGDVLALFPGDAAMQHVSAQIEAKCRGDADAHQRIRER